MTNNLTEVSLSISLSLCLCGGADDKQPHESQSLFLCGWQRREARKPVAIYGVMDHVRDPRCDEGGMGSRIGKRGGEWRRVRRKRE